MEDITFTCETITLMFKEIGIIIKGEELKNEQ